MNHEGVEAGRLVVCPTPIGNLADVTLRVLDTLRDADILACEDTRRTRVLLNHHGIEDQRPELVSYHEHNERDRLDSLLRRMREGATVALVCDAGMPLISDPGFQLVGACLEERIAVSVLPGPSSVTTAVVSSGMASASWSFAGFLPRRRTELVALLARNPQTLVVFESARRLGVTLSVLAEHDPQRPVAVCRELTKLHEEVRRGTASQVAACYERDPPRGELVLVVGAAPAQVASRRDALTALSELVAAGAKARTAAGVVSKLTGVGANELYRDLIDDDRG